MRHWRPARKTISRNAVALAMAMVISTAAAGLELLQAGAIYQGSGLIGPLYAVDAAAQDLILRIRPPEAYVQQPGQGQMRVTLDPRDLIRLVAIDERTIAELGAYNGGYPRRYHAQVLEQLLAAPPRVVAYDIGFFEQTADDAELARSFGHARSVGTRLILADVGLVPPGEVPRGQDGELLLKLGLQPVIGLASPNELALVNVLPDSRGTIRSMPLVAGVDGVEQPTLGLAALTGYLRRPRPYDGRPDQSTMQIAGRDVPVDATSSIFINYFGPPFDPSRPDKATFQVTSFVDVLRGRADPSQWRDRVVIIGVVHALGLAEDYWTPVSDNGQKMAGAEIHANVAATLLSTQFLRPAPIAAQVGLTFGLAIVVALLAANLAVVVAELASVVLLVAYVVGTLGALFAFGVLIPLVDPLLASVTTFVGIAGYRVAIEQRQARRLQAALAAVVPPRVAEQIAREPERIPLTSQRRVLTVLFGDLEGFTSFSERTDPDCLSRIVAEYLEAMTTVVFAHGGTVDKFIGDAVMGLWNAPLDDAEHAEHACAAALDMQAALAKLSEKWVADGLPHQRMRIGIHTGVASVGNMGTPRRFAYTAIGDTVNLAARLEPLNNIYGSRVCVSQDTLDAAGGPSRWLDRVAVKGRSTPVVVYQLLGQACDSDLNQRMAPLLEPYHQAMLLYQARQFEAAGELFEVAANGTADGPSALYAARCKTFLLSPPAPDWNGVFVLDHK